MVQCSRPAATRGGMASADLAGQESVAERCGGTDFGQREPVDALRWVDRDGGASGIQG